MAHVEPRRQRAELLNQGVEQLRRACRLSRQQPFSSVVMPLRDEQFAQRLWLVQYLQLNPVFTADISHVFGVAKSAYLSLKLRGKGEVSGHRCTPAYRQAYFQFAIYPNFEVHYRDF